LPGAQSGFLGKLSAEHPMLATGVLALGVVSLCVLGMRNSGDASSGELIARFLLTAGGVVCAPMALAALTPQKPLFRIIFLALMMVAGAALLAAAFGKAGGVLAGFSPPPGPTASAVGLFAFLAALAPLTRHALRLGVVGPLAALPGVAGGAGYFAMENLLSSPFAASAAAIALAGGAAVGAGVGADFAQFFARGLTPRAAAAAAGHAAVAPASFTVLAVAAYVGVVSLKTNYGAVDWHALAGACAAALLASLMGLVGAAASLALTRPNEQVAVDENRRRQRFVESWRPFRRRLPATTALAATAIAGVIVVIAAFEAGVSDPLSLLLFLALILIASGFAFVSVRTSLLIAAILFLSTVFAGYVYAVLGIAAPAMPERFAALTLCAIALSQLTVSWRNAGDIWRNARDIAQNAMSDGLQRFAIALGAGAAATMASAYAFSWEGGVAAAAYFALVGGIGLFLSPVLMVAFSAQLQRY
jgi:hypothetical protein